MYTMDGEIIVVPKGAFALPSAVVVDHDESICHPGILSSETRKVTASARVLHGTVRFGFPEVVLELWFS